MLTNLPGSVLGTSSSNTELNIPQNIPLKNTTEYLELFIKKIPL